MGYDHAHDHRPARFDRAFALGIALNLGFVGIEAFYGWRVGSLALLADAGHNLSDVAGLLLAWAGSWAARREADARHTYGWRRASILAAFVNAVLLLVAMAALAWEAVQRFAHPAPTEGLTIMVVAAAGIVINTGTALLFVRDRTHDLNIRGAFLHMAADALVSLGVVISGALYGVLGWAWIDPAVSLAIAVVVVLGTWRLFRQSLHLLFDGVPDGIDLGAVHERLRAVPGVADVHDVHVWAIGTTEVALTAHLVLQEPGVDLAVVLRTAKSQLHEHFGIHHATLQLEPPAYAPQCAPPGAAGCTLSGH
jgi:cobalt-zinc-cadmium efflux system protein